MFCCYRDSAALSVIGIKFIESGVMKISSAEHLKSLGKKGSRATVYRTLDLLVAAECVKKVSLGTSQTVYEHVHSGEHHDHLVCVECGVIIEFYSEELEKCQDGICDEESFTPIRHSMVVFGKCKKCSRK